VAVAIVVVVVVTVAEDSREETVINMTGTVKWYDKVKGFGFIQADDRTDYFVHRTGVKDEVFSLEAGQAVEFNIKESDKGPVAVDVETR
jgi:CspA family cold shock protein